jgi:hypothetical protein
MSTTDVAGSVVPVYTPTLPVTDDGSILTNAALTALTLSLANRTEYVRQLSEQAGEAPEFFATLREDFLDVVIESTSIYGVLPWTVVAVNSGALSISHSPGTAKNPGGLICGVPSTLGDASHAFFLGPGATSHPFTFASVQSFTVVLRIGADTSSLGTPIVRAGLAQQANFGNGGTDSLGIAYLASAPANWFLFKRVAGVQTTTALIPMVLNEYIVARFEKNAAAGFDLFINGSLFTTIAAAALPTGGCTFGGFQEISTVEGLATITPVYDAMFIRNQCGARNGA